jgi:hypothetical protein
MQGVWHSPNMMIPGHYDPRSGFPYYNLTTTHRERSPLSATLGHAEQLCGFEPWVPSPVPSSIVTIKSH